MELSTQMRETPCLYMCSEHCDQEVRELRMRTQGERFPVLYTEIRRGRKGVKNIGYRYSLYCILYIVTRR